MTVSWVPSCAREPSLAHSLGREGVPKCNLGTSGNYLYLKDKDAMDSNLQDHWLNLIRPLFKPDADFKILDLKDDYEVVISWKLHTDLSRPSKRSKTIRIIVSRESVEDYQNKSEHQQKNDDEKLTQFIKLNLENFEPNHDSPIEEGPPEVKWITGSHILNS